MSIFPMLITLGCRRHQGEKLRARLQRSSTVQIVLLPSLVTIAETCEPAPDSENTQAKLMDRSTWSRRHDGRPRKFIESKSAVRSRDMRQNRSSGLSSFRVWRRRPADG